MSEEPKPDFWKTPEGIAQRVDNLAQVFSYRVVNNSFKVIGVTNGAKWMRWILHPEKSKTGPCKICIANSQGGRNGYYKVNWFTPAMPAHDNGVCEWEIIFKLSPFDEIMLGNRAELAAALGTRSELIIALGTRFALIAAVKTHFKLTDNEWNRQTKQTHYLLLLALLAHLLQEKLSKCVKKLMREGKTQEEAEEICRERETSTSPVGRDEIERSKQLLGDPRRRMGVT